MNKITVKTALKHYYRRVSLLKKGFLQEKSRIAILSASPLGELVVKDVTSVQIAKYRDSRLDTVNQRTGRKISPSTVRLELALLSSFFKRCRDEWGWSEDNPVERVAKPKSPPGRDRRLTPREDKMILRYAAASKNPELYAIIILALTTAMRQGEILSLDWSNVNLKKGIAHLPITKNGSMRDVPLSQRARSVFLRLPQKTTGKVFTYTANGLKSMWRHMLKKLGIEDLHFHDLRHEAVSRLFELGTMNSMEIAAISGHKSMNMLKRYTHLSVIKLIPKLEGLKTRGGAVLRNNLVPYPSLLRQTGAMFELRVLAFPKLAFIDSNLERLLETAAHALKVEIIDLLTEDLPVPDPDSYDEVIVEEDLVMLDPRRKVA